MEFKLLKSKDDYSFEHYETSPLSKITGFIGTAGEALLTENGLITLFVDPRYHIQAEIQTKGKEVAIVKMSNQMSFLTYLKNFLPENSTLLIPEKSTSYTYYKKIKEFISNVSFYDTEDDPASITDDTLPVFEVPFEICGKTAKDKIFDVKIDNFLITNLEDIAYLLNLRSYKTKNTSTFRAKLFIKNQNEAYLFTDYKIPDIENVKVLKLFEYPSFIKNIDEEIKFSPDTTSMYDYNLIKKPMPVSDNPIKIFSSIKNEYEIKHYKDCFKKLDNALFSFREKIKTGLSEFELNEIFENELKKAGAFQTSFKTILAIGENSSIIHYTASSKEKILKQDDIILLDCGGYFEGGYATDITRVFSPNPKSVSKKVKEIYTAVLKAQLNIYHSDILYTDELHKKAYNMLKEYEKEGFFFPHGLGHGIGIMVHQAPPTLSDKIKQKIVNNNVFTIEPGLYKENAFGIRLENTVYLKDEIKTSLSKFPYEEDLILFDMLNNEEKEYLSKWQKGEI